MSRHVRQYLQEPDRLFRRVRDAEGNLKLSKRAAAYHPGRGEYRSSYRNAMRLARTETNAAYRAADCDRWGSIPFVVGMEVKRSNHPFGCEVCEALKGKYPKDFVFTGWHPQCRCYIVPVLADEKERMAYHRAILNGEDVRDWKFSGEITEPHEGFQKWMKENQERVEKAAKQGTLPYWMKDNGKYVGGDAVAQQHTELEADVNDKTRHLGAQGNFSHKETKASELRNDVPMKPLKPEQEVLEYTRQQAEKIGAKMTKPMSYEKADKGYANKSGDDMNCQSTVVAFFARLLGMNVTAKEYKYAGEFVKLLEEDQTLAYYISPTKKVHPTPPRKLMSIDEVMEFIDHETAKDGIYNIAVNKWRNDKDGHIMCLIKCKGRAYLVDIQEGERMDIVRALSRVDFVYENGIPKKGVELLRVDNRVLSDEALQVLNPF